MATNDYAILVGIARYRDSNKFPPLDGPLNDVERVRTWLVSETGGGVPEDHVYQLTTTPMLMGPSPAEGWPPNTEWVPNRIKFSNLFNLIAVDQLSGEFVRREGRLYLYFSGHGFSQLADQATRAALYSADNFGKSQSNLAGTLYAEAAKRARLFREVVLIMDCCRDTESNVEYNNPDLNKVENENTEGVRVFAMYAAPKRGKAQERELPEANGKVVGLMTNAWLRSLKEAPCDVVGRVPGKVLMQYIGYNWRDWYPKQTPPTPRIIPPDQDDVFFRSGKSLVRQVFHIPGDLQEGTSLRLTSESLNAAARLTDVAIVWRDVNYSWSVPLELNSLDDGRRTFSLDLPAVEHLLVRERYSRAFVPGAQDAVAL